MQSNNRLPFLLETETVTYGLFAFSFRRPVQSAFQGRHFECYVLYAGFPFVCPEEICKNIAWHVARSHGP